MRKLTASLIIGAAMFIVSMLVASAQAQNAHSWIASNGSDSVSCDRPTPCATFAGAIAKTNAGGEITCVDSGNYQGANINKSITINCENAIGSTAGGGTSIGTFIVTTAAADRVILRGLDIDGGAFDVGSPPFGLILFNGAGVLHVDKVKINNMRGDASGIRFAPNGSGPP